MSPRKIAGLWGVWARRQVWYF